MDGCTSVASDPQVLLITGDLQEVHHVFTVYPNPATEKLMVDLSEFLYQPVEFRIVNSLRQAVRQQSVLGGSVVEIRLVNDSPGLYVLIATQGDKMLKTRYVVAP